jgi:hypothetical protein
MQYLPKRKYVPRPVPPYSAGELCVCKNLPPVEKIKNSPISDTTAVSVVDFKNQDAIFNTTLVV